MDSLKAADAVPPLTSAHGLAVVPVGVAGVHALDRPQTLLHDEAWRAGEGDGGAQLIRDVAAAEISMGHVGLPAVLVIKGWKDEEERQMKRTVCVRIRSRNFQNVPLSYILSSASVSPA